MIKLDVDISLFEKRLEESSDRESGIAEHYGHKPIDFVTLLADNVRNWMLSTDITEAVAKCFPECDEDMRMRIIGFQKSAEMFDKMRGK